MGTWVPLGTQEKPDPKQSPKMTRKVLQCCSILEVILGPILNDFLVDFLIRLLDHGWSHVGRIFGAKMEPKSMKNRFKIRSTCQSDCSEVPEPFWLKFGSVLETLGRQKWSSRLGEVLFFRKYRFFRPDAVLD